MLDIWLPIAHQKISILMLFGFGLGVGFLAGFFGVGGGVIMTPLLMAVGVPPNVAVGSGLAIMVGASISGTVRHTQIGNVDYKLAVLLLVGSSLGVQVGAWVLDRLSGAGAVHIGGGSIDATRFCLSICYMALLFGIGISTFLEPKATAATDPAAHMPSAFALRMRGLRLPPYISLGSSGVERFPLPLILLGGLLVGFMAGLLGIGGGIVMVPFMMYFLGLRTQRAVGTSLCQICFTAAVGAGRHAFMGNVDPILAVVVLAGSLIGARLGASATSRVHSPHLRRYFGLFAMVVGLAVCVTFVREMFFQH